MIELPRDDYGTIIADPPWSYFRENLEGCANLHYPTQSDEWIEALPVADSCAKDCVLLLWATWPKLDVAMRIVDAWGFSYVTGLPWVKVNSVSEDLFDGTRIDVPYGVGFWIRGATEPLLIARRGKVSARTEYVGLLSPNLQHSRKPDSVYQLAEAFDPQGPRAELFARRPRTGWDQWGHEA